MIPRPSRSKPADQQTVIDHLEAATKRLETIEDRQRQLERTVAALARENGTSLGCPCTRCHRSYTLAKSGVIYCPECGYRHTL
ncbi:hypothetical protein [Natronococcus occultus]|uniref:Uncharacterized protein n=1 Tax=Natronococcus occultus SP4 TaxID=694430 RepID=L0JSQ5_9EURY|nr:hypothetical protein [Natronococcus occultus]AGB36042.1 hypothetical protein Natoc_0162 [Natronococcus occultus SP4]